MKSKKLLKDLRENLGKWVALDRKQTKLLVADKNFDIVCKIVRAIGEKEPVIYKNEEGYV